MNHQSDRWKKSNLPQQLIDFLEGKDNAFPYDFFANDTYSETKKLKAIIDAIGSTIQNYAADNTEDIRVRTLIKTKVHRENLQDYLDRKVILQLFDTKTLKRCLDGSPASPATIEILEVYKEIIEKREREKEKRRKVFKRISGIYHQFVTHSSRKDRFQESIYRIEEDGSCVTKYVNSDYEIKTETLIPELVGDSGLLLKLKRKRHLAIFYLYIGGDITPNYNYIQGVFIYSNTRETGNMANLAVFKKIRVEVKEKTDKGKKRERVDIDKEIKQKEEDIFKTFVPFREREDILTPMEYEKTGKEGKYKKEYVDYEHKLEIRQNIQYFLSHHCPPIKTFLYEGIKTFDFSKSLAISPGPYGKKALHYNKIKKLEGDYYFYFNERYPSVKKGNLNDKNLSKDENPMILPEKTKYFSSVGKSILKIKTDKITGALKGKLCVRKNEEGHVLKYEGFILNNQLHDSSYVMMLLYLIEENKRKIDEPHRCIYLLLNFIDDNKLLGNYSVSYTPPKELGTGIGLAIKTAELKNAEPDVISSHNRSFQLGSDSLEDNIVNFFSNTRKSLIFTPSFKDIKDSRDIVNQGIYKLYSQRKSGGIRMGFLVIFPNGYVMHIDSYKSRSFGDAQRVGNVLNIILENEKNQRTGFFCFRVDNTSSEKGIVYRGTFSGTVKRGDEDAIASRVVIHLDSDPSSNLVLTDNDINSLQSQKIPESIEDIFKESVNRIEYDNGKPSFLEDK